MGKLSDDFKLEKYGLHVRLVNEDDAAFIVELRTDYKLGKYINATENNIEKQKEWIREYKKREKEGRDYYFIFFSDGKFCGVNRIYNITIDSFTTGSWVFSSEAPIGSSILANIITREIAYKLFSCKKHLFDVKRANTNVNRYHATFKSTLLYQDELTNYYICSEENFEKYKNIHLRMFAQKIEI
ncbi:hypothetical protein EZS27_026962 [termite gut metagenome]|uniref:N-acetyltransferase domain-containing protein n=1 Tax=termite gut metagenome TaxID=433724 RepID=A0A5J4QR86_9ZZZZ